MCARAKNSVNWISSYTIVSERLMVGHFFVCVQKNKWHIQVKINNFYQISCRRSILQFSPSHYPLAEWFQSNAPLPPSLLPPPPAHFLATLDHSHRLVSSPSNLFRATTCDGVNASARHRTVTLDPRDNCFSSHSFYLPVCLSLSLSPSHWIVVFAIILAEKIYIKILDY